LVGKRSTGHRHCLRTGDGPTGAYGIGIYQVEDEAVRTGPNLAAEMILAKQNPSNQASCNKSSHAEDNGVTEIMSYDAQIVERVRRMLSQHPNVVEKRMIGGLSFLLNGNMCCGVTGSALMVRVGRAGLEQALAEPHVRPMEFAGRRLAGFVCVDSEGFRTETALAEWVQRGLDFAATLPMKEPDTKRPGSS
jgi:TfoX/Sxy family transcriptional regulator of competence genes